MAAPEPRLARLSAALVEQLHRDAWEARPREACGLLLGRRSEDVVEVVAATRERNAAAAVDRFLIPARDVLGALRRARRQGLELLGPWHSHPGTGPEPSAVDAEAAWGDWTWLILSAVDRHADARVVACWRGRSGTFSRMATEVVARPPQLAGGG